MIYEYLVIAGYFLLIIGIGFTFKKMAKKPRRNVSYCFSKTE